MNKLMREWRSREVAHEQMAALFLCSHCGRHALRESVPATVTDLPLPTNCWISCPWGCGRGPMELAAPPIVYSANQGPPTAWRFVRHSTAPVRAVQTATGMA